MSIQEIKQCKKEEKAEHKAKLIGLGVIISWMVLIVICYIVGA
ncbi:MAG: hypothetical protein ACO3UU_14620 [Minisyncoccia bacterium]